MKTVPLVKYIDPLPIAAFLTGFQVSVVWICVRIKYLCCRMWISGFWFLICVRMIYVWFSCQLGFCWWQDCNSIKNSFPHAILQVFLHFMFCVQCTCNFVEILWLVYIFLRVSAETVVSLTQCLGLAIVVFSGT
jgi:hypothetical protein